MLGAVARGEDAVNIRAQLIDGYGARIDRYPGPRGKCYVRATPVAKHQIRLQFLSLAGMHIRHTATASSHARSTPAQAHVHTV